MPDDVRISKFLSLVLRHAPEKIGLTLDAEGWGAVDAIIRGAPMALTAEDIFRVVATSDKKRFALSPDGTRIRAQQGHSVAVDLGLVPEPPPPVLWHGTVARFLASIEATGLRPMNRHHVHLSPDHATAAAVGARRGPPVVLCIDAAAMAGAGHLFFQSGNGVWLTGTVPPGYIERSEQA